ncbi:MAG: TlpA disulfide reductase family protein [Rhodanobacter sp.]
MRRLGVALFTYLFCFAASAQLQPGNTPPDDLGSTLDGTHIRLSTLQGKVVVISFWATWCSYCMKEMPVLAGLQTLAAQRHLPLQVVYVNSKESHHIFATVAHALNQRMPTLLITSDLHGNIGKPYGADKFLPVMVMLHRDGTIADIHRGYDEKDLDGLLAEITALLNEPAPAPAGLGTVYAAPATRPDR